MHVDLWHWPLTSKAGEDDPLIASLRPDEELRAQKFLNADDTTRFRRARGGLRHILARQLDCAPLDVPLDVKASGKPFIDLSATPDVDRLEFNLSHSHDLAVLALSFDREVGIDVERLRPVNLRLARRFFTSNEADAIESASMDDQLPLFFQVWTGKEAVVKATGEGIKRGLDTFEVPTSFPAKNGIVTLDRGTETIPRTIALTFPALAEGYTCALALADTDEPITTTVHNPEL